MSTCHGPRAPCDQHTLSCNTRYRLVNTKPGFFGVSAIFFRLISVNFIDLCSRRALQGAWLGAGWHPGCHSQHLVAHYCGIR
jgi:hypothetical protein